MTNDKRARFTLRLPQNLLNALGTEAESIGVPMNALILQILWDWLRENDKPAS